MINKQTNMKKLFVFMCSIFLCAVLAGCKNNADGEQSAGSGTLTSFAFKKKR